MIGLEVADSRLALADSRLNLANSRLKLANLGNFHPNFAPNFAPNFHNFFEFSCFVSWERRPEKFTKKPRHFSLQNSQIRRKNPPKLSGESAKQRFLRFREHPPKPPFWKPPCYDPLTREKKCRKRASRHHRVPHRTSIRILVELFLDRHRVIVTGR